MGPDGARLRAVREAQGRTQADVAAAIRYDQSYLSRVERGLQRPSVDFLRALSRELGLKDIAEAIDRVWSGK